MNKPYFVWLQECFWQVFGLDFHTWKEERSGLRIGVILDSYRCLPQGTNGVKVLGADKRWQLCKEKQRGYLLDSLSLSENVLATEDLMKFSTKAGYQSKD